MFNRLVTFSILPCSPCFPVPFFIYTTAISIVLVVAKNGYSVKDGSPFRERSSISIAKNFYYQIFPFTYFLIKPVFILLKSTKKH